MELFRKWWFWLIVLAVILLLFVLPIWCTSYYLPSPDRTGAVEARHCGPILDLFKVY